MDNQAVEDLLSQSKLFTKREICVHLAYMLGRTSVYDIQSLTGFKKDEVVEAVRKLRSIYINIYIGFNNISTVGTAQTTQTPPKRLANHLYSALGRGGSATIKELAGIKATYLQAYLHCRQNQAEAVELVKDCIDVNLDNLKHSSYPGLYLKRLFDSYLSSLPEVPWEIRENAKLLNRRLRYDPKIRQYALAGDLA